MDGLSHSRQSLIRSLFSRQGRKKSDLCVCEGARCCRELATLRPDLVRLAVRSEDARVAEFPGVDFHVVSGAEFEKISSTVNSQGVLMVASRPEWSEEPPASPFVIVLDRVSDPGNAGTIFRTARAAGIKDVWLTEGSVDPYSDKTIRAATASQFALRIRLAENLGEAVSKLTSLGFKKIYRTDPHKGASCFEEEGLFDRSVIVLGSEGAGAGEMSGAVSVTIPMPGGAESINVAQAATVILFEHVRRSILLHR